MGNSKNRRRIPDKIETAILLKSKRRCCLCFGLNGVQQQTRGQIAHLDNNPGNNDPDNLAFFCQPHHDEYDARYRQTKKLKIDEVKKYRSSLYRAMTARQCQSLSAPSSASGANRSPLKRRGASEHDKIVAGIRGQCTQLFSQK